MRYFRDSLFSSQPCKTLITELSTSQQLPLELVLNRDIYVTEPADPQRMYQHNNRLVIVGQTMNLKMLFHICDALGLNTVIVQKHPMYMRYGQAVCVLHFSNEMPSPDTLVSVSLQFNTELLPISPIQLSSGGLLVMDMDSTVIAMECIDEIADLAGVKPEVAAVTERAMRGEIEFADSLLHRVACLQGVDVNQLDTIRQRLPLNPQFLLTMQILKQHDWTLVLASGGFTFFADYVKDLASLDYAFSNTLEITDGFLTGKVIGNIVDGQRKATLVREIANEHNIPIENTVAIGDGANDLLMMETAGWSVAYHAKPTVRAQASSSINCSGFDNLLYMLAQ